MEYIIRPYVYSQKIVTTFNLGAAWALRAVEVWGAHTFLGDGVGRMGDGVSSESTGWELGWQIQARNR